LISYCQHETYFPIVNTLPNTSLPFISTCGQYISINTIRSAYIDTPNKAKQYTMMKISNLLVVTTIFNGASANRDLWKAVKKNNHQVTAQAHRGAEVPKAKPEWGRQQPQRLRKGGLRATRRNLRTGRRKIEELSMSLPGDVEFGMVNSGSISMSFPSITTVAATDAPTTTHAATEAPSTTEETTTSSTKKYNNFGGWTGLHTDDDSISEETGEVVHHHHEPAVEDPELGLVDFSMSMAGTDDTVVVTAPTSTAAATTSTVVPDTTTTFWESKEETDFTEFSMPGTLGSLSMSIPSDVVTTSTVAATSPPFWEGEDLNEFSTSTTVSMSMSLPTDFDGTDSTNDDFLSWSDFSMPSVDRSMSLPTDFDGTESTNDDFLSWGDFSMPGIDRSMSFSLPVVTTVSPVEGTDFDNEERFSNDFDVDFSQFENS
jgi:hypothetical protein